MLTELQTKIRAMLDAHDAHAGQMVAHLATHKAFLTEALAAIDAELARVPTLTDVKDLLAKIN